MKRLAYDVRMRDAFTLLAREFSDDEQWRRFIFSAWAARINFEPYREKLKRAKELREQIADAAENLAKLLRGFTDTGVDGPSDFHSIRALLMNTDNPELQAGNYHLWRAMRPHLVGDLTRGQEQNLAENAKHAAPADARELVNKFVIRFVQPGEEPKIDKEQQARDTLRYIWNLAPDLSAMLDALAIAARAFQPREHGMIGAAIDSRQRNVKTEYLRAFANRLTESHGFTLTSTIMGAMAVVANVAINAPAVDVSYDDVRKALAKFAERAERPDGA